MSADRAWLVTLIEDVVSGRATAAHALDVIKGPSGEGLDWNEEPLNILFHELHHFHADADIRVKDPDFAAWQTGLLARIALQLSRGGA